MDKSWISRKRTTPDFGQGVEEFIRIVLTRKKEGEKMCCPCKSCGNMHKVSTEDELRDHIFWNGFSKNYNDWIWHGEWETGTENHSYEDHAKDLNTHHGNENEVLDEVFDEMFHDTEDDLTEGPPIDESLLTNAETPLYPGCSKYTRFTSSLELFELKAEARWTDYHYSKLMAKFKDMFPKGNTLPSSKEMLCPMGLDAEKIHACPNDCVLYRKDYNDLHECPTCWTSRYKVKRNGKNTNEPAKAGEKKDGMLRHAADSPQWKHIDTTFPNFSREARNLRLGLCTDGINPFDVYLAPVIEDLKKLWDEGERVYDEYRKETFTLRVMLFCTINDFLAYGNLTGNIFKGYKACPICEEDTKAVQLRSSKKVVYPFQRVFLPHNHPYRWLRKDFNGNPEHRSPTRKTKDGKKARNDMVKMGIRLELKPTKKGKRYYLPPACYTLSNKEK
ncbi:uncharacterized protein [Spinacia oleracea]|uniref:Transposase-associated domain-containing protein n=1 Tax=Spinacia oleracea TaxID=3562 RepID=A0A9R0K3Y4_SPIOL|nr:uncharacterized protein LOC110795951 [Spinacia oleracea]